jgi:hypothetical protein
VTTAKLQIRSGKANEKDYKALETALENLKHLSDAANLRHTPKLQCLLTHAQKAMRLLKGIGDFRR